jgi:uncharacterized membrane protein
MSDVFLFVSAFLASAVEFVEALTIVLALGLVRGWRSVLAGTGSAVVALAILVAALGPALSSLPIDALRLVVGALLLVFGLQWLRKAILRSAGIVPLHDEEAVFREERRLAESAASGGSGGLDGYAFALSFKGVFLEGFEVAFIVITFGAAQGRVALAAAAAGAALVLVAAAGLVLHRPLARVPENSLKLAVGLLLTTFGTFWAGEGTGVDWPGGDLALPVLLALLGLAAFALVRLAARGRPAARVRPVERSV